MSTRRIWALILRNLYLYKRSFPRLIEVFYWPIIDLLMWGFIMIFLSRSEFVGIQAATVNILSFFIGAFILWSVFMRSSLGVSIAYLEDQWSRNLLNLFVSPLSELEFIASILISGLLKVILALTVASLAAWALYHFNIFGLGLALIPFAANLLVFGWIVGLIASSLIMRFGHGIEVIAWGLTFLIYPFSAVFYPVSVFPPLVRKIVFFNPLTHVFEGMRSIIQTGSWPGRELWLAFGLNGLFLLGAVGFFLYMFSLVRRHGYLLKIAG